MAPLFSSMTISNDAPTSPKRRNRLLGRPSFFSRPSVSSTTSSTTLNPLDSHPLPNYAPSLPPKDPLPLGTSKSIDIAAFLSSRPSQSLPTPDDDSAEQLKVSLLPSALSNSSLGPSSAPNGPTPSTSLGGISASTSRNTVLPASHPILTSSGSTFLPPSLALGFELQETENGKALPTLASAIKLPSPARPEGVSVGEKTGVESVITRKPVPGLSQSDIQANTTLPAPTYIPISSAPAPTSTLPRSTSGTSIFGSTRLGRITSRSSVLKNTSEETSKQGAGMSLGRRISRRLSIDHIRPMFNGGSTKRRMALGNGGQEGGKMDIQRWVQGAVSGVEAGEAPPIIPATTTATAMATGTGDGGERSEKDTQVKAKERLVLPGIRTWRSKFSSSKIPPPSKPKQAAGSGTSYTESVRSQRLDSWVDVGSVRSNFSGYAGGQGQQGTSRGLAGALRRMEGVDSPATISVVEASESADVAVEPPIVSPPTITLPSTRIREAEPGTNSPLDPSAQRSAALLNSLLARPSDEAIAAAHLPPTTSSTRTTPGFPTSISASSLAPPTSLMSPAADDKSLLEPMRSPPPELPIPGRTAVGVITEAEEIVREVRSVAAIPTVPAGDNELESNPTVNPGQFEDAPSPLHPSVSRSSLAHPESGLSFHTAQSSEHTETEAVETIITLPSSQSKSAISTSSLIERTEREQGEGWWSAPRIRPETIVPGGAVTRSTFITGPRSSLDSGNGSPVRPRKSEDRRRQSTSIIFDSGRRPVASAVAKFESANNIPNSPRRSILRPSKLQFADADESVDGDCGGDVETPTRSTAVSRRVKVSTTNEVRAVSPVTSNRTRHRRDSTTDPFSKLFFAPLPAPGIIGASPSAGRPDEVTRLRERHALELDALVSALTAAKAENDELRGYATRAVKALEEETALRKHAQKMIELLEARLEGLMGSKQDLEFRPELSSIRLTQPGSVSRRTSRMLEEASFDSSPSRRLRRGCTRSTDVHMNADEFGRLEGSESNLARR